MGSCMDDTLDVLGAKSNEEVKPAETEVQTLLSMHARKHMKASARWASFFAMVGFIGAGIMFASLLTGIIGLSGGDNNSFVSLFAVMIPFIAGYFLPCLFLSKYAKNTISGLKNNDIVAIETGQKNLKNAFLMIGIITVLMLVVIIVSAVILFVVGTSFSELFMG